MKAQTAIFILMAYSTTGAFAQNVQVPVDLVKREGNLRHYYHDPETIYIDPRGPKVKVIPQDQPEGETTVEFAPQGTRAPGKTVIHVPASQFAPVRAGRPKVGNFDSNLSPSGYHPAGLQPGQTSRILSGPGHNYTPPKPTSRVAQAPETQPALGQSSQASKSTTELKYNAYQVAPPTGASGGDQRRAIREVSGTLKPGDLIHSAQNK